METARSSAENEDSALVASQLALAESHSASIAFDKAIPYLQAAAENGASPDAKALLLKTLADAYFAIPVARFTHPYPVLFFVRSEGALYVALAGQHPTVVRWDLGQNTRATAVLFPTKEDTISHLSLSSTGDYLIVHRGKTNLLCLAKTLKPIVNLGTFPSSLNPDKLQPFSKKSLLIAHPTAEGSFVTWHIRDSATGEILRTESFPLYPRPSFASFEENTLVVNLEDHSTLEIPIVGNVKKSPSSLNVQKGRPRIVPPPQSSLLSVESNSITMARSVRIPSSLLPSISPSLFRLLPAITGYSLNPKTQALEEMAIPERLEILSKTFPSIPPTFAIHTCETTVVTRLAAAFPEEFPRITATARAEATEIEEVFAAGDSEMIKIAIRALPPSGLATSTALFLSLNPRIRNTYERLSALLKTSLRL